MKKTILFALLAVLGMNLTAAQENEYVPFVREGVKWVYYNSDGTSYHALELKGDTVLGGKTYKVMRKYSGSVIFQDDGVVPVCLREENKVVYGIVPGGKTYADCPIGLASDTVMQQAVASGQEFVLYDFNEPVEFMESRWYYYGTGKVIHNKVNVGGRLVNSYIANGFSMTEGIGYDGLAYCYTLSNMKPDDFSPRYNLSHVIENGEIIYRSEQYKQRSTFESTMLITQEGVKWVNERVVVSHGDTTRCQYTYEFKGHNSMDYSICYSYEGEELDENATFAAYVMDGSRYTSHPQGNSIQNYRVVSTIHNGPQERMIQEGRNMIKLLTNPGSYPLELYGFGGDYSDVAGYGTQNYFIRLQKGDFLSRDNFVEVEPLIIGEDCCRRFAFLGEDGQPLAYVIEGIGFDSRDMGDLLTPFTSKPDPDADYQVWCGLSHVIKDGQIIYKGMCYHEPQLAGDVNGDGNINMDDLTDLINILLNNTSMNASSDINGDDTIGMDDLTDLINILLTH